MMDVCEMLLLILFKIGDCMEVFGWLVDIDDGLFVFGDYYLEDYEYLFRVKIDNGNIMYLIFNLIFGFVGGWLLLFY